MPAKVFISSTDYDLLDIRAELEDRIRQMHLIPVLSGRVTSSISPLPDANSIETCLAHVRGSEFVLCILDKRYGPSLKEVGFDDVSATHLEYREARKHGKKVLFYVRDRLEADFAIWKRNRGKELSFSWPQASDAERLFRFMEEQRALSAERAESNWRDVFRDSLELKHLVARDLREPAGYAELDHAIRTNMLPMLSVTARVVRSRNNKMFLECVIRNIGNVAAFNVESTWRGGDMPDVSTIPMFGPSQETCHSFVVSEGMGSFDPLDDILTCKYQMPTANYVIDEFRVICKANGSTIRAGATLVNRRFRLASAGETAYRIDQE